MTRRSMRLLAVGIVVGGCSRDAPIVAPNIEAAEAMVAPAIAGVTNGGTRPVAAAIDDALQRLVPSLGARGIPLRAPLLELQKHAVSPSAWGGLRRALEAIEPTLTAEYRPDLDALRLHLEAFAPN